MCFSSGNAITSFTRCASLIVGVLRHRASAFCLHDLIVDDLHSLFLDTQHQEFLSFNGEVAVTVHEQTLLHRDEFVLEPHHLVYVCAVAHCLQQLPLGMLDLRFLDASVSSLFCEPFHISALSCAPYIWTFGRVWLAD